MTSLRQRIRDHRITKIARVLGYATVVMLGLGALAAHSAYGDVKKSGLALGHELGQLGEGPTRPVRLNGQRVFVASHVEDISLGDALDRMEEACKKSSAALFRDMTDVTDVAKRALPTGGLEARGIVREGGKTSGYVACFARDANADGTFGDLVHRLKAVAVTGELAELGALRYLYAEMLPGNRTRLVGAWTEGSFNLRALVPHGGDAPGSDAEDAPRPIESTRVLTADVEGTPYAVRLYRTKHSADDVVATYDKQLTELGWQTVEVPGGEPGSRAYHGPHEDLVVSTSHGSDGTVVSVVAIPSSR